MSVSPEEEAKRRYNVEQAFHSSRMEGFEPSTEAINIAEEWIQGKITMGEMIRQTLYRYKK